MTFSRWKERTRMFTSFSEVWSVCFLELQEPGPFIPNLSLPETQVWCLIKFEFVIKNIKLVKHIIFRNSPTLWIKIPILTIFRKHIRVLGHTVICSKVYHFYNYWKMSSGFLIDSRHSEILSFNVKTYMKIQFPILLYKQTKIENKSTNIQNPIQIES